MTALPKSAEFSDTEAQAARFDWQRWTVKGNALAQAGDVAAAERCYEEAMQCAMKVMSQRGVDAAAVDMAVTMLVISAGNLARVLDTLSGRLSANAVLNASLLMFASVLKSEHISDEVKIAAAKHVPRLRAQMSSAMKDDETLKERCNAIVAHSAALVRRYVETT